MHIFKKGEKINSKIKFSSWLSIKIITFIIIQLLILEALYLITLSYVDLT